ncbi:MAG: hypothetical protein HC877_20715 [Thioploca sp.]|nr:hypothetical protein [Thioploca sp.]
MLRREGYKKGYQYEYVVGSNPMNEDASEIFQDLHKKALAGESFTIIIKVPTKQDVRLISASSLTDRIDQMQVIVDTIIKFAKLKDTIQDPEGKIITSIKDLIDYLDDAELADIFNEIMTQTSLSDKEKNV